MKLIDLVSCTTDLQVFVSLVIILIRMIFMTRELISYQSSCMAQHAVKAEVSLSMNMKDSTRWRRHWCYCAICSCMSKVYLEFISSLKHSGECVGQCMFLGVVMVLGQNACNCKRWNSCGACLGILHGWACNDFLKCYHKWGLFPCTSLCLVASLDTPGGGLPLDSVCLPAQKFSLPCGCP